LNQSTPTILTPIEQWATDLLLRLAAINPDDAEALKFILENAYTKAYQDGAIGQSNGSPE
jgi:hypothetical protein